MLTTCVVAVIVVVFIILLMSIMYCKMYNPYVPSWYQITRTPWYGVAEELPTTTNPGNSKVAVFMVATPEITNYSQYTIEVNKNWCKEHNYDFYVFTETSLPDLPINFSKIEYAKKLIESNKYQYIMYIDSDAMIIRKDYDVRHLIKKYMSGLESIMFGEDCFGPNDCSKPGKINSGVFIVKSNSIGKNILESWLNASRGKCSKYVNMFPSCQLIFSNCVFPKWFWAIRIVPFNLMNGYKGSLLVKHMMAMDEIKRTSIIKDLYKEQSQEHERIKVW